MEMGQAKEIVKVRIKSALLKEVVKVYIIIRNISKILLMNIILKNVLNFIDLYKFLSINIEKCSKIPSGGTPGDGDGSEGSCDAGKFCCPNRLCSNEKCSIYGAPGDGNGVDRGNCPGQNDVCKSDGCCEGIYSTVSTFPLYWQLLLQWFEKIYTFDIH